MEPDIHQLLPIYQRWLPVQVIEQLLKETGRRFYTRLLPPILVLWGFIFQRLSADHTCDVAWCHLSDGWVSQVLGVGTGQPKHRSESVSGYCQSRRRLPVSVARGALNWSAQALRQELGDRALWHGHPVNLMDGSTLLLQATPELSQHYGVASNQHGASHWPLMRLVAGFDLFSGAVYEVAEGPYQTSEHHLASQVILRSGPGWVYVGDRNFGVYHLLQVIVAAHSDALLRLKVAQAKRVGASPLFCGCDLDVVWSPSRFDHTEPGLPTPAVGGRVIYVRLEREGFRPIDLYLFTTLTDRKEFPIPELVTLYGRRWGIELDLRHVKTTLKMERLDGKSVDIVQKELLLGLLAYNLLRGFMAMAALRAQRSPGELSLAQCWRRIQQAAVNLPMAASVADIEQTLDQLLARLGRCILPRRRQKRFEPRAVWGRPRVYPTIKGSRDEARQLCLEHMNAES